MTAMLRKWYWRAAIAMAVGFFFDWGYSYWLAGGVSQVVSDLLLGDIRTLSTDWGMPAAIAVADLPVTALVLLVYGVLTVWAAGVGDGETRCRKCRYILKGITEPRCPECGERI